MKVRQKDSLRKLQLSDKSALKATDTLVTKVSAAQLHIHKYKLKSCTNLQLPACCSFIHLQKSEGKILPRAQQIQGLSSFAFVCVSV